jgi:SAM-dependent methyltransferase
MATRAPNPPADPAQAAQSGEHLADLCEHLEGLSVTHEDDFRAASLAQRLLRHSRGGRVLDAGCGTGLLSLELLKAGCDVVAVDHEESMVKITTDTFGKGGFLGVSASKLSLQNLDNLGAKEFDEIYCCDVVEHVQDDLSAMRQLRSLLRPNGQLILTVPAWPFLFGERDERMGHYRRYSRRALLELCRSAGFRVASVRWWNLSGFLLNAIGMRLLSIRFSEKFRYASAGSGPRLRNAILKGWFQWVENRVRMPLGLTLIVVADRDSAPPAQGKA